MLTSAVKKIEK